VRVLIIGALGQLGSDLSAVFADTELHGATRQLPDVGDDGEAPSTMQLHELDLLQQTTVEQLLRGLAPEIVINTAAAHHLPTCETDPGGAFELNAIAAQRLAVSCNEIGARLIHISTDYVFDGANAQPYTEEALPAPLSIYGASKLAGEHLIAAACPNHLIIRTAALYGHAPCKAKGGMNFPTLMLHLAATRPEVRVVTDEITTPTFTHALARQIRAIAADAPPGLYHATCQGSATWFEFAQSIFTATGTPANLLPATSADFPSAVRRPSYSVLENSRLQALGRDEMPHWRDALGDYLGTPTPQ